MSVATVKSEYITIEEIGGKPQKVYWETVGEITVWPTLADLPAESHEEDRLAGFVPLSNPKPAAKEPEHPFPSQAMTSHWHWRHGA